MSMPLFQAKKLSEHCPKCGGLLQLRQSKRGLFQGCSNYPACDYLHPLQQQTSKIIKTLEQNCPECGNLLVLRQGHFGMFIGCSHYPECHFIVHNEPQAKSPQNLPCPNCEQGKLVARRGRQGKVFYGCDTYPQCKFTLANEPHLVTCPVCQGKISVIKKQQDSQTIWQCINKQCKHHFTR